MKQQRGITLIGAVFVLVIVSLLAKYLLNIAAVQRQTGVLALQTARVYQSANTGIEWASFRIINANSDCSGAPWTLELDLFTTTINCIELGNYQEANNTMTIYQLTSQSQYSSYGQLNYVSRTLQAIIHD